MGPGQNGARLGKRGEFSGAYRDLPKTVGNRVSQGLGPGAGQTLET